MKKLGFLFGILLSLNSFAQNATFTNYTGYAWDVDVYITPISTVTIPLACAQYYQGFGSSTINQANSGALILHGSGTIPESPSGTGCSPTAYCAYWSGDELAIGITMIPPGYTIARVDFTKSTPGTLGYTPTPGCFAPLLARAEISGSCGTREPKAIACALSDGRFWFQLDHPGVLCDNSCAHYASNFASVTIGNW